MMYALYQGLKDLLEEGLEDVLDRHQNVHQLLVEGLEDLGLKFIVDKQYRLPSLNAVTIPDGIDDITVRSRLLNDYDIEIGGGLGKFSGKVWRIGLMGHSARKENIEKLLSAFKKIL